MPNFAFSTRVPRDYAELVWQVFFASRQRGIDLKTHFPWLLPSEQSGRWVGTLKDGGETIAGLVVKALGGPEHRHAALGLVCVAPEKQGQGWGRHLLSLSVAAAREAGIDALTLWTGKPEVYAKHGFEVDDSGLLGWIQSPFRAAGISAPVYRQMPWPDATEASIRMRGLPPYAQSAVRVVSTHEPAELIVIHDTSGPALAEWQGTDEAVVELLTNTMPDRWRLNALSTDTLPAALDLAGARLQLQPSRLQMWLSLSSTPRTASGALRLLDRI